MPERQWPNLRHNLGCKWLLLAATGVVVGACAQPDSPPSHSPTLTVITDTSTATLATDLLNEYEARSPDVVSLLVPSESEAAFAAIHRGDADVALLFAEPREGALFSAPIARNVLAVIVHPDNPVDDISPSDLRVAFSGHALSWESLGGERWPIHLIVREPGTSTRHVFQALVMVDLPLSLNAELAMSNAHLVEMVASDPTALGFTTLQDVPADGQVKTISVGGAPATLAAARNREYRLVAAIMFVAREEPTGASRAFLEWVLSSEGQAVVRRQHLGLND